MNYIPNAEGLTQELLARDINLVIGQPTEEMAPDGRHKLTRYEVFNGDKRLGVVEVNSWNARGVTQIDHVVYTGVIPSYKDGRNIGMTATALRTLDASNPEYWRHRDFTKPNNTQQNPLYRHDGHPFRLANHEADGLGRIVLSEEEAMKLERDIQQIRNGL